MILYWIAFFKKKIKNDDGNIYNFLYFIFYNNKTNE